MGVLLYFVPAVKFREIIILRIVARRPFPRAFFGVWIVSRRIVSRGDGFRRRCSVSSVFGTLARRPFPLSLKLPRRCRARGVAFCVVFGAFLGRLRFRWVNIRAPYFRAF